MGKDVTSRCVGPVRTGIEGEKRGTRIALFFSETLPKSAKDERRSHLLWRIFLSTQRSPCRTTAKRIAKTQISTHNYRPVPVDIAFCFYLLVRSNKTDLQYNEYMELTSSLKMHHFSPGRCKDLSVTSPLLFFITFTTDGITLGSKMTLFKIKCHTSNRGSKNNSQLAQLSNWLT